MYRVLRPVYTKTGEVTYTKDDAIEWCRVEYVEVGVAEDMLDALRKFPRGYWSKCYSFVLEEIGRVH